MPSPPNKPLALVVEDEQLVRLCTVAALREAGFETLEARDGEEAIHLLEPGSGIAVLITDIDLPGPVNGFGLAWRAHSLNAAVLVISGRVLPAPEVLPPGARFLAKPVLEEHLIATLHEALAR